MANAEQPKILVIDDERGPRESLRILLKNQYNVLCADSVDWGIQMLEQHEPDTIIMDIRMPVMDGFEASRSLRSLKRADAQTVPIIAMTANIYNSDISEITNAGMDAYIAKPFVPSELYRVIATQIAHGHTPA